MVLWHVQLKGTSKLIKERSEYESIELESWEKNMLSCQRRKRAYEE